MTLAHDVIKTIAQYIALVAEGIAVVLIIAGVAGALWRYVRRTWFVRADFIAINESRNHLAHSLSLSLEFLIGADILRTAISPTWEDIGKLAAIVGIRTVLNFYLTRELKPSKEG